MSSWGWKGYSEMWLQGPNDWVYRHLHKASERMTELAEAHPAQTNGLNRARSTRRCGSCSWAKFRLGVYHGHRHAHRLCRAAHQGPSAAVHEPLRTDSRQLNRRPWLANRSAGQYLPGDRLQGASLRKLPRHIAISMDGMGGGHGNGDSAHRRHREGVRAVRERLPRAVRLGIECDVLCLFHRELEAAQKRGVAPHAVS